MQYTPKSTKFGFRNGLIETSDFQASRDDKGLWSGTQSFYCALSEATTLAPANGAPCSFPGFSFMACSGVTIANDEGDLVKVTVRYGGSQGDGTTNGGEDKYSYDLTIVTQDEPLISHYKYKDLDSNEKKYIKNFQSGKFAPKTDADFYTLIDTSDHTSAQTYEITSELGKELIDFISKGIETYLAPSQVWRVTYSSKNNVSASTLNKIGKITSAPHAPGLSSGRNWLFVGVTVSQKNKVFSITEEFRLSGLGGWVEEIYS